MMSLTTVAHGPPIPSLTKFSSHRSPCQIAFHHEGLQILIIDHILMRSHGKWGCHIFNRPPNTRTEDPLKHQDPQQGIDGWIPSFCGEGGASPVTDD